MDPFEPPEPEISDYYADLGLSQQANSQAIKHAFFKLAREHHPDKKAPGTSIDAQDFRKIRQAFECLRDGEKRAAYDLYYFDLQDQWTRYRQWQKTHRQHEEQERADREQRVAREKAERAREAAEAEKAWRMEEEQRAAREKAERERVREERARQAEERSREAARRAREQQQQAARERLRKDQEAEAEKLRKEQEAEAERRRREKEAEAERRSQEAARKIRIEQERAAQERLRAILIQEKQDAVRHNWTKMRDEAEHRGVEPAQPSYDSQEPACRHPQFGWPKKNGGGNCVFCGESRRKWAFRCPECHVPACPRCKDKYCLY